MFFNKFSVSLIVRGQINSMKEYGTNKRDWVEIFIFFFIPLSSPILQTWLNLDITKDIVGIVVSAASIFAGLLLNLLVLLYSILCSNNENSLSVKHVNANKGVENSEEKTLIEYTFYNISYAVLACVVLIVSSLVTLTEVGWWVFPAQCFFYYFGFQIFIAIAQILKRFHSLMEFRVSRKIQDKKNIADQTWG